MKQILLGIILCGMTALPAQAQLRFGVAAGLNYTTLSDLDLGSTRTTYDNRSGWHAGIFVDLGAGPLALRPGVFYLHAGRLFEDGLSPALDAIQDNFDLNFIVVPIDVRLRMATPVISPYFLGGPELRFRSDDVDLEIKEALDLRSFNLAGNAGFGVEVSLGGYTFMPEFRYSFDISGITGDTVMIGDVELNAEGENKSRAYMLRLGLAF